MASRSLSSPSCLVPLIGALSLALLAGCGADADAPAGEGGVEVVAGRIEQSDAVIAKVRDPSGVVAYVCGGSSTLDAWTRWYRSSGEEGELSRDGWSLVVDGEGASGTLTSPQGSAC